MKNIYNIGVLSGLVLLISCDSHYPVDATTPEEKQTVDVTLSVALECPRDAYDLNQNNTRSTSSGSDFYAALAPSVTETRGGAVESTPDKLYNLELGLYNDAGGLVQYVSLGSPEVGSYLTLGSVATGTYQLVLIARGSEALLGSINGKTLSKVRTDVSVEISKIATLSTAQADINKMPYVLYLEKVQVTSDGKLCTTDATHTEIRLLLKRLAARVTLKWEYTVSGYNLTEVSLMQVPRYYRAIPNFQGKIGGVDTYPSLVDEYTDAYRLDSSDGLADTGIHTVWVPANVRGIVRESVNPSYRSKDNAPTGAMYAEFRLENAATNKRLFCRIYIGGNQSTDFNVRENTDYTWNVALATANVADDRVSEQTLDNVVNSNLVTTANCFMMEPGTDICFNPYKHEAGTNGVNTYLNDKTIDKVQILWQCKDAGTNGELVMGYVASANNHRNIVNYANLDNRDNARIYVKVPKTKGGNAIIAAYNAQGTIVWSWHIWVTDYIPVPLSGTVTDAASRTAAIAAAKAATQNGAVHAYDGYAWTNASGSFYKRVIMDRNIGAIRGTYSMDNALEAARAYGFLYQWGRKDPFPGSVDGTATEINVLYDGDGKSMELKRVNSNNQTLAIQNPGTFYTSLVIGNGAWAATKTIHDPCPAGWQVPEFTNSDNVNIFKGMAMGTNVKALVKGQWVNSSFSTSETYYDVKNGFLYKDEVWFPLFRLREDQGRGARAGYLRDPYWSGRFDANFIPSFTLWSSIGNGTVGWYMESKTNITATPSANVSGKGFGFGVRCVQKR